MNLRGTMWRRNKPGWQPPESLLRRMKKLHPRISLVWSTAFGKWGLVEKTLAGPYEMVAILDGRPTVANTIFLLNRASMARLADWEQFESFERELDESQARAEAIGTEFTERIGEGADRLYNLVRSSHVVAMSRPKFGGNPLAARNGKKARRRRPA